MTAGQHVRLDPQPVPRHLLLEGGGEEAVIGPDRDADRDGGPRPEVTDGPETASDSGYCWLSPDATTSGGTSCRK